ncbi:MAG: phosphoenolpyruvate hydrolase family protein [Thermoleophilia bacterium]|nr:phosphoenolpyruvate hydrolase family protein [Thermoleophilia bacterium]
MSADALVAELHERAAAGPLVVVGVGSGLSARGACEGGADLLACYSTATHRVAGLPSALAFLPYGDANEHTLHVLPEVVAGSTRPVIAGFGAHDPRRRLDGLVGQAAELGAAGVTNEPFIGMYQGDLRAQLEAAGLGFEREVALVEAAVGRGLAALGWAWNAAEARRMAAAGAPIVGAMLGVTAGGAAGSEPATSLDAGIELLAGIIAAARAEQPGVLCLIHGGPLNEPGPVAQALARTGAEGYVAGSTAERVPAIKGIAEAVRAFKQARVQMEP